MSRPFLKSTIGPGTVVGLVGLWYLLRWDSVQEFVEATIHCPVLFCDFTRHYLPMGQALAAGKTSVPGFFYPAPFAALMRGMAGLSQATAVWLWGLLQGGLLIGLAMAPGSTFLGSRRLPTLYLAVLLTSEPVLQNLAWGQVSTAVVLLVVLAFVMYPARPNVAAFALAAATGIKFYAVLMLPFFLLRRDWRFLARYALGSLLVLLVMPVVTLGLQETLQLYARVFAGLGRAGEWIDVEPNSQYYAHVLQRWIGTNLSGLAGFHLVSTGVGLGICGVHWALLTTDIRASGKADLRIAYAILLLLTPFLVSTSWMHYFVYLPLVQVVLLGIALQSPGLSATSRVLSSLLVIASIAVASSLWHQLAGDPSGYGSKGYIFLANLLALIAADLLLISRRILAGAENSVRLSQDGAPGACP